MSSGWTSFMNALSNFIVRVEEQYPLSIENEELNALLTTIRNQSREIAELTKEVESMRKNVEHYNEERKLREAVKEEAPAAKKAAPKAKKAKAAEVKTEAECTPAEPAAPKKRCCRKKKEA